MEFICRPAHLEDLPALLGLRRRAIAGVPMATAARDRWIGHDPTSDYRELMRDEALWLAESRGELLGSAGLRLDNRELIATFVAPKTQGYGVGRRLVEAIEGRACEFLIHTLRLEAAPGSGAFYEKLGYLPSSEGAPISPITGAGCRWRSKPLVPLFNQYQNAVAALHEELGLPKDYGARHRLPIQPEPVKLVDIGEDIEGRTRQLISPAAKAWQQMRLKAAGDGIELQLVSAFRSVAYQADIIRYKLGKNQSIEEILRVSAAPGFSEHHNGRVVDLSCPGSEALEDCFEDTDAFAWLQNHAADFGFQMSYPRNNRHGIAYEPWHWAFVGEEVGGRS